MSKEDKEQQRHIDTSSAASLQQSAAWELPGSEAVSLALNSSQWLLLP